MRPDDTHRCKDSGPKIEYITEFGSSEGDERKLEGYSPPPSPPPQVDALNRSENSTFNSCKDSRLDRQLTLDFVTWNKFVVYSRSSVGYKHG